MKSRKNQSGQVIIEYVLLLVIAVSLAALLTKQLVNRRPGEEGILITKWQSMLKVIGDDFADDPK
jgi:hypothetical protein